MADGAAKVPGVWREFSQEDVAAAEILWPLRRIFESVLVADGRARGAAKSFEGRWGGAAIGFSAFSDRPIIVWTQTFDQLAEHPWRTVLDELQLRLLDEQLVLDGQPCVVLFCHEPIGGAGATEDPLAALPDAGELARFFAGRAKPLIMMAGLAREFRGDSGGGAEHLFIRAARVLDTSKNEHDSWRATGRAAATAASVLPGLAADREDVLPS